MVVQRGVAIIGPVNLPSTAPYHSSQMYSKNITTFLLHIAKSGSINLDIEDEIVRETLLSRDSHVVNARVLELLEAMKKES